MKRFSVLDLVPVVEGGDVPEALARASDLARHAEESGYARYWVAEHHGMPGIASAATSIVLAQAGAATRTIRIGAGGIMLPNHSPLVIAEQFGTLEALFPGRVDLGLGRAPGSDQIVARALRRDLATHPDAFPNDVVELQAYFAGESGPVRAVPGAGANVPLWILGSSLFGAQLAAALGLPYAFASHFAPDAMDDAIAIYRERFRPSAQLAEPYVMLGFNVFVADTDAEATRLASSMQQAFVALRTGRPQKLPPPVDDYYANLAPPLRSMIDHVLMASAVGAPDTVEAAMTKFVERTKADELIFACMIHDYEARKKSLALAAEVGRRVVARTRHVLAI